MINTDDIIKIASYFSIIAHTPGRLRVRVSSQIKKEGSNISINDIENLPNQIDGIISIKIKKIIGSVTIMYNPEIFPKQLWDDLIAKKNLDEITSLINKLMKEVS